MIFIEDIEVSNFAGVAKATYNFADKQNVISGASGSGKSSAYNAYLWALGFTVPTWEPNIDGYRLLKVKTEVKVHLNINGIRYTIGKTNEPKYKINKFTGEEEYTGTDFKYWLDEQEMTAGDYKNKIAELYGVDYFTLELLSNISLFNNEDGKRWDKNERRKYLFKLFDLENKITELSNLPEFECIKDYILKGKDELEINQILNTMKTSIENEMKSNQVIMEEKQKELTEYSNIDFTALENKKNELTAQIEELNKSSSEMAKNTIYADKQNEISKLNLEINKIKSQDENLMRDYNRQIFDCESKLKNTQQDIDFCNQRMSKIKNDIQDYEIDIEDIGGEVFDESTAICPTCKQVLPEDKVAELKLNFESKKTERLNNAQNLLIEARKNVENISDRINALQEQKSALEGQLEQIKETQPKTTDVSEMETKISALNDELKAIDTTSATKEINEKISALKLEYENTIKELAKKDSLEKITARIEELKSRARELGVQDSERIAKKQALQLFTQKKVDMINYQVNNNFVGVRYNFFKFLSASAAKEYESICSAVLTETGVEYEAMSSGQKVKADLFTNNSLRNILNVQIPQFVDDCVLSDFAYSPNNWQTIYLVTDNSTKVNLVLVKDVYSLKDCDVRNKD